MRRTLVAIAAAGVLALGLTACDDVAKSTESRKDQLAQSQSSFEDRTPPQVTGDAEYQNYIRAQEDVYDDPASIIWCTVYPENPAAPIFTVPIAGKLTSSSVSYYPNYSIQKQTYAESMGLAQVENQSVDGMYHGSPPPYRYGFTPGGQYVDFFNLPTFCTTALTEFQRQTLKVATVQDDGVTEAAEEALRNGDTGKAQEIVDGAGG